jgi:serine-type D-Ala-D-Ala carboxypeptidase (penicillin-binding protein 5/6)
MSRVSQILRARRLFGAAAAGIVFASLGGAALAANNSVQGAPKKDDSGFQTDAPQAILIEAKSGSVLFEKNPDTLSPPSAMAKLMTMEIVFGALTQGKIKPTDEFMISENAWRRGGAPSRGPTMFAAINSRVKVEDLLRGAIVHNGNDAAIAFAEGIANNERAFTAIMTQRARELGLKRSTFANATGLSDPGNKMSVREIGMLARHIVVTYPDLYKIYNERDFTWNKIFQQNRNPILAAVTGADGMVAGVTKEETYGIVGSAVQNDTRLIVVINGMDDPDDRVTEAKRLLAYGFNNFETRWLFNPGQEVGSVKVFNGDSGSVAVVPRAPVGVMVQKNNSDRLLARIVYDGPVRAPITAGQQVGMVRVTRNNNVALEMPVYAKESVGTGSMPGRAWDNMTESVIGLFVRTGTAK